MKRLRAKIDLYFDELTRQNTIFRRNNSDDSVRVQCRKGEYLFLLDGSKRPDYALLKRVHPYIKNPTFFKEWVILSRNLTIVYQTTSEEEMKFFIKKYFVVYNFVDCEEEYSYRLEMIGKAEKDIKRIQIANGKKYD